MADDKYKSAGNIRSKITRFDFEGTAKANLAVTKQVGDVASAIENKSDEQNRRFDKLLKVLEFLPKDVLEQRKQQKAVFVELAKTTAAVEKAAKDESNPLKKVDLLFKARELRKQGSYLAPDHDPSKARGIKEILYKAMGIDPQYARENSLGGAIAKSVVPTFHKLGNSLFGEKDDAFSRQVKQEKMYPEAIANAKKAMFDARLKGVVRNTDEEGIKIGRARGEGGSSRASMDGIGSSVILRKIADTAVEIRDYITGKNSPRTSNGDFKDEPPKGLFDAEELDKRNPANWKTFKKRDKNGRFTGKIGRIWNKKSQYTGKGLKAGQEDVPPPEPEVLGLHSGIELTEEQKAKAADTYDEYMRQKEGQDQPHTKFEGSGTEKEEPTKIEGSMTDSGGSGMATLAILAAITEALPIFIGIAAGVTVLGLVAKNIYDYFHKGPEGEEPMNPKHEHMKEPYDPDKYDDPSTGNKAQKKGTYRQFASKTDQDNYDNTYAQQQRLEASEKRAGISNDDIGTEKGWKEFLQKNHPNAKTSSSGDTLDNASSGTIPTVIAPVTNNTVNNNGGGSKGSSGSPDTGMPSVRTPDPSIQRWQDKRQSRIF